jgi:dihydroorotate dehydrogenase (fumarate)
VIKALLAGADIAMMTSALLRHGPDHLSQVETQVIGWLDRHGYQSPDQVRGKLSQRSVRDPAAFERANYLKVLASHRARPADGPPSR